jgi:CxxC motif-containing protein (DUF1111 family)
MPPGRRRTCSAASPYRLSLLAAIVALAACDATTSTSGDPPKPSHSLATALVAAKAPAVGGPVSGLTADQLLRFQQGSAVFQIVFTPEQGLGPLFNAPGCASCHEEPVVGGAGSNSPEEGGEDIELHATRYMNPGCDNLGSVGGQVIQQQVTPALFAALAITKEPVPAEATATGLRTTPDLFGFGLLDAVPEATILALADPFDSNGDGISGRAHLTLDGRVGRFGRKAQDASLRDFNTGAFVMEMGITDPGLQTEQTVHGDPLPAGVDPTREPEIDQLRFDAADAFVQTLAPPPQLALSNQAQVGQQVFSAIGCAKCHTPTLRTGASPISALSFKDVNAYTDLLLHDMGPALADICLGDAQPSEFRTEPLMGLRFGTAFLHDGRALTIEQAILAHDGEAARSRRRFSGLPQALKGALLKFLNSL